MCLGLPLWTCMNVDICELQCKFCNLRHVWSYFLGLTFMPYQPLIQYKAQFLIWAFMRNKQVIHLSVQVWTFYGHVWLSMWPTFLLMQLCNCSRGICQLLLTSIPFNTHPLLLTCTGSTLLSIWGINRRHRVCTIVHGWECNWVLSRPKQRLVVTKSGCSPWMSELTCYRHSSHHWLALHSDAKREVPKIPEITENPKVLLSGL